jgi:Fe-S cluster assembly iron-binding protein IscA
VNVATQVPEGFEITDSALRTIRSLVAHPRYLAYVCWVRAGITASGDADFEGWSVVSFEERDRDKPVEFLGIHFLFDPQKGDELIGKTLDWIDGHGFNVT